MAQSEAAATEAGKALGRHVHKLREAAGLSQEDLAQQAGTSRQTIAMLESGIREPRYWTAWKIARVLGVTMDELAGPDPKVERVVVEMFPRRVSASSRSTSPTSRRLQAQTKPGDNTETRTLLNYPVDLHFSNRKTALDTHTPTPTRHDLTQVAA